MGEVLSSLPILRILRDRLPDTPLYVSTGTTAGRSVADRRLAPWLSGVFFLPFDYGYCVRRTFRQVRPALLIVVETELWPNLFATAYASGTALALINARISDRTWPTYRKWQQLFRGILAIPQLIQAQSTTDLDRLRALGAPGDITVLESNLKYDAELPQASSNLPTFDASHVWVAASTVGPNERGSLESHQIDEDDLVLDCFNVLSAEFPRLLLVLAPRQPARFDEVAAKLKARGTAFVRRSESSESLLLPGVLLLDTMGELSRAYRLANVVFVGGSLAPRGGHNIIEPAAAGVPVVVGPHMQNFATIAQDFLKAGALVQIENATDLPAAIRRFLVDTADARAMGTRAREVVEQGRGVSERSAARLLPLYFTSNWRSPHAFPIEAALKALATVWTWGGKRKRERGLRYAAAQGPLPARIISVGGLSVGGAGKTPFTLALCQVLRRLGRRPAILTRGYRRESRDLVVAAPGDSIPEHRTGDEAQIFLRRRVAPIGISADRNLAARALLSRFPEVDTFVLDDGFQHARFRRDLDIVLIDGLNPFGNRRLFPAGILREPLDALERAQAAVITRCDDPERFDAISRVLLKYNPRLCILQADTHPLDWRVAGTDAEAAIPAHTRAAAFCGLGNPDSFWRTLDQLGIAPSLRKAYRDHHRYRTREIAELWSEARAKGATVLLTTEKDAVKLPKECAGARIFYLSIELKVRDERALVRLLETLQPKDDPDLL